MHDAAERDDRRPVIAEALPAVFDALGRLQLAAVTVSELRASAPGAESKAGAGA
jgi:hypothetical protein